ncbi:MAG: hypothetical protein KatS3mg003_1579 [Candidatus Nitrosocaldaceae archaeon]|nr:MAG: hypothetical protein KatS3mg003_1579 [Candidatus Nitrosocaldaceae archaeon]
MMMLLLLLLLSNIAYAEIDNTMILSSNDVDIYVKWEPIEIKPNELVNFELNFMKNNTHINTNYDFIVVKDDVTIKEVRNSFAIDGKATHIVEFPSSGSFSIIINILENSKIKDSLSFDLKVTPEFPMGSIIVAVTLIAITIALTRLTLINKNKLGSDL